MTRVPADSDERLFLRIVEGGSLKAAAAQLGVDPSAVSRRLSALEAAGDFTACVYLGRQVQLDAALLTQRL